jgi:nucleoid-associated protein YgaU
MRKDVKFGLTIGAILVVTLVIYVIVLSRGPSTAQKVAISAPTQSDRAGQSPAAESDDSSSSADSSLGTHADEAKPDNQADQNSNSPVEGTTPPADNTTPPPATQPAAVAQPNSDWDSALNHGLPMSLAAPEHTVTPTIDSTSSNLAHGGITRSPITPMIDPLPSTQPSRPLMADVPTLDAPATVTPPPAAQYPSTPSYTSATNLPSNNTPRSHRVASGESPYSISQAVYGSGKYYKRILAANPGIDPRHLKVGQILIIPELTETDSPASSAAANTAAPASIDTSIAYKVLSGDSLESISLKLYGTPQMVDKLYEMNKTLIGADENVLKIGWILKLPQAPAAASAQR